MGRLTEQGQHYSKHGTFLEIAGARDSYHGKQRFLRSIMVLSRVSKD